MATREWLGNAVATKDVWTITVANTWAGADTGTITINGKDLVVTIGTLTSTAQVATSLKQAWESESFTDTTASCIPQGGGTSIPEMSQLTATVSSSTVILTADTAGVPHTISVSENTAGTGTLAIVHTTTATGPNYWDNIDNWTTATVPTGADDVIIDRAVAILYGLDNNAVTLTSLTIGPRFTTTIGLPVRNSAGYEEYREDQLKISVTTFTCKGAATLLKWNGGSVQTALTVYTTGTSAETNRAAFQFVGTHNSNAVNVIAGDVGIAGNDGESATVATLRQTGGTVFCGTGATLTTINKTSGTMTAASSSTSLTNEAGSLTINGGTQTLLIVDAGTVTMNGSPTITAMRQNGGTITSGPQVTYSSTVVKSAGTLTTYSGIPTLTQFAGTTSINAGNITLATVNGGTLNYDGTGTATTIYSGGGTVNTGPNVTVTTIENEDGTVTMAAAPGTMVNNAGDFTVEAGNITAASVLGGTFAYHGSGTITALGADNCTLDFSGSAVACTVVTYTDVGRPVRITDPARRVTWTNGLPTGTITLGA